MRRCTPLACIVDTSLSGWRVVRDLAAIAELRGLPCMVVRDNGTELTGHAVLAWCQDIGVAWHYIAPGKALLSLSKGRSRTALWHRSMVACATSA